MVENVFVLGLDAHNAAHPARLPDADRYRFHPLLRDGELAGGETIDLPGLLDAAQRQIEAFDGPVHAVIGFWDFPVSTMVPILCERLGLRWATTEAVVKCEHKYWSRLEQAKVIDEVPAVRAGRPRRPDAARRPAATRCGSSRSGRRRPQLAFRADDPQQLADAAATIRAGHPAHRRRVRHGARPAGAAARAGRRRRQRLPGRGGGHRGAGDGRGLQLPGRRPRLRDRRLVTVSGRHQLPALPVPLRRLPPAVADRMAELSRRVIRQIGSTASPSTSSTSGTPSGTRSPCWRSTRGTRSATPSCSRGSTASPTTTTCCSWRWAGNRGHRTGEGPYAVAAKWFVRRSPTAWSAGCPPPRRSRRSSATIDGCTVEVTVAPGERLSRAARPGQLQLRDRQRLPRAGERGRPDPQVRAGCRGAAVRDRRSRTPTLEDADVHEDRRPLPASRSSRTRSCRIPHVGRDPPRRAGLAAGGRPTSGPCRPSWSSSRTGSAT